MFSIFAAIAAAIFGTVCTELVRLLCRVIRQHQLGVPVLTATVEAAVPCVDATQVFNELLKATADMNTRRDTLIRMAYVTSPPGYPELNLTSNALKSVQKSVRALDGLINNMRAQEQELRAILTEAGITPPNSGNAEISGTTTKPEPSSAEQE